MTNWESLTVAQLKEECKSRGLSVGGNKADLVAKLEEHAIPIDVLDAEIADNSRPPTARSIVSRVKQLCIGFGCDWNHANWYYGRSITLRR